MSKTNLADKQVKELNKNPYIKLVYEMIENNKTSKQVFYECGIDTNVVGEHRVVNLDYKWKKDIKKLEK